VAGPRLLIVGGSGLAGGYIASAVLESTDASLVLAARDGARLREAAARVEGQFAARVSTTLLDASEPESLKRAFDGVDAVVVAAQANRYGEGIARAALDAAADVIDITYTPGVEHPMEPLRAEAEASERCLVTDAGLLPGLAAFLVRLIGGRMDRLDTAFVGAVMHPKAGWPHETMVEVVEMLSDPPVLLWRDGDWRRSRLLGIADRRTFDFGPSWGHHKCSPVLYPEMRAMPELFPSLRETGTFHATNAFADGVALPLAMIGMRIAPRHTKHAAARFLEWGMRRFARAPYGAAVQVDATGESAGSPTRASVTISHPNEYEATGQVVAALVNQWSDGKARAPGLHSMGALVDPEPFLQALAAVGFETRAEPEGG